MGASPQSPRPACRQVGDCAENAARGCGRGYGTGQEVWPLRGGGHDAGCSPPTPPSSCPGALLRRRSCLLLPDSRRGVLSCWAFREHPSYPGQPSLGSRAACQESREGPKKAILCSPATRLATGPVGGPTEPYPVGKFPWLPRLLQKRQRRVPPREAGRRLVPQHHTRQFSARRLEGTHAGGCR